MTRSSAMGRFVLLGAALIAPASCAAFAPLRSAACPELKPGANALAARYSSDPVLDVRVRTFVQATKDLAAAAAEAEAVAANACLRIGADLGLPSTAMGPDRAARAGGKAKGACDAVAQRIAEMQAQGIAVSVRATLPQCQANAQVQSQCDAGCQAAIDPGQILANCEPGKVSGFCRGTCVGQCDGVCRGTCNGTCSQLDANGNCAGTCQGECRGDCNATCHAYCQGQWQAPRCEAFVQPPRAAADCEASCRASANVRASCTPASVEVVANQNSQAAMALVATLRTNLPDLLRAQYGLAQRLAGDVQTMVQIGKQMPSMIGQAGGRVLACLGGAGDLAFNTSMQLDVTIRASANVTAGVGG